MPLPLTVGLKSSLIEPGDKISPGTLYPILHKLERQGYLRAERQVVNGKIRKYYAATARGRSALVEAYTKARELLDEIAPGTGGAHQPEGPPGKVKIK